MQHFTQCHARNGVYTELEKAVVDSGGVYCLMFGMCVKFLTKARHATLWANWPVQHTTLAITQSRISTLKTSASLIFAFHRFVRRREAASFTQSARPGKVLISFTKIFEGWRLLWRGEMRDGNELRYIPLFHIAHVNFLPVQSTIF